MKPHRLLFSILLLTFWITATWLYATSWLWPQCFAAWKLDNSYMLATHSGNLVCVYELDSARDAPCPPGWTFRLFSGNETSVSPLAFGSGGVFRDLGPLDAFTKRRSRLYETSSLFPPKFRFSFIGICFERNESAVGLFSPVPPAVTSYDNYSRVVIPLWFLWIPITLLTLAIPRKTIQLLRRQRLGLCLNCGYDLRASNERCPECGTPILPKDASVVTLRSIPSQFFIGCKSHPLLTGTSIFLFAIIIAACWFIAPPRILYVHSAERSPTHPRLSEVLKSVEADHQSLEKVLNFLSNNTGVNIITDWSSIESVGIDRNLQINLNLTNISMNSVLKEIVRQCGPSIDFFVDDAGIVHIGTREQITNESSVTRVYDVRDFYELRNRNPLLPRSGNWNDHLSRIITETIAPDSWRNNGGQYGAIEVSNSTLIITNTRENQEKIADFLDQLRRHINPSSTP